MTDVTTVDLFALAPELSVLTGALLVLLIELFIPSDRKRQVNAIGVIAVLIGLAFVIALALSGGDRAAFGSMFVVDTYALLLKGFFLSVALVVLFISYRYFSEFRTYQGEYYFLLLSAFLGCMLMTSARDLVMIFIALELVSVPGFVMAGLRKFDLRSNEGAMKFFLIGVLSVAVLLYGLSIVYGFTGTTDLVGVAERLRQLPDIPLLNASILFVIVGFGFKVSAVPFHFWAPDTYEGAPVPVTAFLSVASKAAGFAGLLQVCFVAFEPVADVWAVPLGIIAVVTMTVGNLTAMSQTNIVRLLAYSSIGHAGYMLVPFAVVSAGATDLNRTAFAAVLLYLLAYGIMNMGAFAVVTAVTRGDPTRELTDYAGLGQRSPAMALALTMALLSLGGLPLLVGFWAKFFVFRAAVVAETGFGVFLASAVVVNSVIAMFYYLKILRTMWMDEPVSDAELQPGLALNVAAVGLTVLTVGAFFAFDLFARAAELSTVIVAASG
ncbi:MAG TPA: NADH-quinone oxidoreductase subunit N [Euzebyales bacterium]|nr:NADH-quinone oxidoreductase subunit N [Euzebyales bacterium]